MSSSNLVRVTVIEESVLGETPLAGNFDTINITSESLSGTPETTVSERLRPDRLSSGQVVTGLTVGGEVNFELSKDPILEKLMASAMLSNWAASVAVVVNLDIDTVTGEITRASGDWATDVKVGQIITLAGFSSAVNNTQVFVVEIVSATVIKYAGPDNLVDGADGTGFRVADELSIGTTKKSFSMEKAFLDLTNKAIVYRGQLVNTMSLNVNYGSIITGTFGFNGVGYEPVDAALDFITNGRTINDAATTNSMNGSIDMPVVISDFAGTLTGLDFCINSVEISLNNNYTAQTCIGLPAPKDYSAGTAEVSINLTAYLANDNWAAIAKKLSQEAFALGFVIKNLDGWYGFFVPALQVSFDDPQTGGQNQDVLLNMSGTAKVGPNGEKSLYIYRAPAA